jgi:hypothetical protein
VRIGVTIIASGALLNAQAPNQESRILPQAAGKSNMTGDEL